MAVNAAFGRVFSVAGLNFGTTNTVVPSDLATPWSESVPAAKTGTLSTRTSDTAGTLTLEADHGITDGQRLDIYWADGSSYGATVGTVSVNDVPFTLAEGDVMPAQDTAVTAMVPFEMPVVFAGDDAISIAANCPVGGQQVFADSGDATLFAVVLTSTVPSYVWISGYGTNPVAGDAVAKLFMSHGAAAASVLSGCVQYDR